jgi:hypothetical protein
MKYVGNRLIELSLAFNFGSKGAAEDPDAENHRLESD